MVDRTAIACRPFGDAWLVLVEDLGGGEATITHRKLAEQGLDAAAAFPLAIEQGAVACPDAQITEVAIPGARCELAVANSFYLASLMLFTHDRIPAGTPLVVVALTWHHWIVATLEDSGTPATLAAIAELAATLAAGVSVAASEWIGTSLWWWPPGTAPEPFTLAALPAALAARF